MDWVDGQGVDALQTYKIYIYKVLKQVHPVSAARARHAGLLLHPAQSALLLPLAAACESVDSCGNGFQSCHCQQLTA